VKRWFHRLLWLILPLLVTHALGTAWHEIVGHGLTGVLCGGRVERVHVLFVQLWPPLRWTGWEGTYGSCSVSELASWQREALTKLAGSFSTFLVAAAATAVLWLVRPGGWRRFVLAWVSIWWIDMFTYTLPVIGLRRSVFWGGRYSEPYEAAVELGIPGPLFLAFVFLSAGILTALLVMQIRRGWFSPPPAPNPSLP
jgi:hypothetical protein